MTKLDSGSIRKDANLVAQRFLESIRVAFRPCRQHEWQGLGGRLPILREVTLKIFPISIDRRSGRQQKGRPVLLTFGVYMGREAPFGDMLLGEESIKERPSIMWGHKLDPNKTPGTLSSRDSWLSYVLMLGFLVQQLEHLAQMQRPNQMQRQIQGRRNRGPSDGKTAFRHISATSSSISILATNN